MSKDRLLVPILLVVPSCPGQATSMRYNVQHMDKTRDLVAVSLYLPRSLVDAYRVEADRFGHPYGGVIRRSLMGDVELLERMLVEAKRAELESLTH